MTNIYQKYKRSKRKGHFSTSNEVQGAMGVKLNVEDQSETHASGDIGIITIIYPKGNVRLEI